MDKENQAAAASRERLRAAIAAKLERYKIIIDDRVEELEGEIAKVTCDPLVLKISSEQLFTWYNEPPAPVEDQKQIMTYCIYKAIFLPVLRWTCLRLFRCDLKLISKELEKDLQKLDFVRIDHHKRETHALVAHCWTLLVQNFDPISEAVESVGLRGGQYAGEPFWEDLEAMDSAELQRADLTAWAMVYMRPWAPIGDGINQVVDKFVTHLRMSPDERERFCNPDILDVLELLGIANSSLKVVALLQRFRPAGPLMFRCIQPTCGLHGFQRSWMTSGGSLSDDDFWVMFPKIQQVIVRTSSGDVSSLPTGPGQRSRNDIAHEAMKGMKRLFKAAGIHGNASKETVKFLKDLSKGKCAGSVTSGDRTSDHPSERAVTVRSETQEHVPYNTEAPTESSPMGMVISAIAEG